MSDSILTSTKKVLGVAEDYTVFDLDILMNINSIFAVLNQLGVGPAEGFVIEDASPVWTDYSPAEDLNYNMIKTYMYMRVKFLFDPPSTRFTIEAAEKTIQEMEWRISIKREVDLAARPTLPDPWSPPIPPVFPSEFPYFPWDIEWSW